MNGMDDPDGLAGREIARQLRLAWTNGRMANLPAVPIGKVPAAAIYDVITGVGDDPASPVRAIRLVHARITGVLDLSALEVAVPLALEECTFTNRPVLEESRLLSLSLRGSTMPGLAAEGMQVQGPVRLDAATSTGTVNLVGAHIHGSLQLGGSHFTHDNPDKPWAINGSRVTVDGHLSCVNSVLEGQLRLISAQVGGVLNLRETLLSLPGNICLQAERMNVGESAWFGPKFVGRGRLKLNHAKVGGGVDFTGSTLTDPQTVEDDDNQPESLRMVRLSVGRNLLCSNGFSAEGRVRLATVTVGGRLSLHNAKRCGTGQPVDLSGATAHTMDLAFAKDAVSTLDLRNARTGMLIDDESTWPPTIQLNGFEYTRLAPVAEVRVQRRIDWLRRSDTRYAPDPYERLIAAYRMAGQEQEARAVALAKERARRRNLSVTGRIWGVLIDMVVGYGYQTWRAGVWLIALTTLGAIAFGQGRPQPTGDHPTPFRTIVYTLDVLLPVADFGQDSDWHFTGPLQWLAWAYILFGWLLTSAVVAGVSRLLSRP